MSVVILLLLLPLLAWGGEAPLTVFICAGQSNMVGARAVASELPPDLAGEQTSLYFTGTVWVPLKPGVTEKTGFGPEIAFAQAMAKALGQPVGILKHSKGGTNLAKQWNPQSPDSLYTELTALVTKARASRPIKIAGMVWVHGAADANAKEMAAAYGTNLTNLIATARRDFASPDMAFVCGRSNNNSNPDNTALVRKAQESCPATRYGWINCDDLETGKDGLHYNATGMVVLGQRLAERMQGVLPHAPR